MDKALLEKFIKYAKEEFDCDILAKPSESPDTFESIFGISFLEDNCDEVFEFEQNPDYKNQSIHVILNEDNIISVQNNSSIELAASIMRCIWN